MNNAHYSPPPLTALEVQEEAYRIEFRRATSDAIRDNCMRMDREEAEERRGILDTPRVDPELIGVRTVTMKVTIPRGACCYATNRNGDVYAYELAPTYSDMYEWWVSPGGKWFICQTLPREDWRESLVEVGK